jgi:uncharacterized protein (TIGR02246 family)
MGTGQEDGTMKARAPEDVDRLFGELVNAGDLDALIDLYEPGASLVQPDGSAAVGPAAIRAALGELLGSKPRIQIKTARIAKGGGGDLAVLYSEWRIATTGPDGARAELEGKSVEVVRRQADGSWKFAIDDPHPR